MSRVWDTLLAGLVDDAGLFPPESLDMASALARHADDRRVAHPMHSQRFLCPASRVGQALQLLAGDETLELTVIADGDDEALGQALTAAADDPRTTVVAVEASLAGREVADRMAGLSRLLPRGARLFVECGWQPGLADRLAELAAHGLDGGAKLRCGGVRQELFPTAAQLAGAVQTCAELGVPWKATAGLHRAVRYTDPATDLHHHGFANVLLAAAQPAEAVDALAIADGEQLATRLAALDDAAAAATRRAFTAYGSCSTSEPVAEAAELGRAAAS